MIEDALKADRAAQAQALEAAKVRQAEIDAEVEKQVKAVKEEAAKARRLPYDEAPYVTQYNDTKFDNLSAGDLALGIDVLKSVGKSAPAGAVKSLALKLISENGKTEERDQDLRYIKAAMPAEMKDEKYLKAAGDLNASVTNTGFGPEWVGTAYSAELWRSIRHDGGIVGKIPSVVIPDGFASQYFPLEDADPTWYHVAENLTNGTTLGSPVATITSSQVATGQKNLAVNKAGARVTYSGELTEDSIVSFAPQLRAQLVVSGAEMMEHVVIDGDTTVTASANINAFDSDPDDAVIYGLLDGFRHLALITTATNSRAGGSLSIEDYIETLRLMGTAGLGGSDPSKVSFIVDANVHWSNMKLPEVATRDVYSAATIENGFLMRAYGVEILPSWQMHKNSAGRKTNSAGKIVTSEATNLYGAILAVRWDQWKMGYKRRMTIESTRFANSDSYEIVALTRFGLAYRDGEAAAITYGISV
jgi:hypothetical protein